MSSPFMYASPEQVMRDRADYARKGIARGRAIVALEYADGVVFLAENPSATLHKVSEIYDKIAFAGVGKYDEYERLRIIGIRQADLKGYAYAREDVTARALANLYAQVLGQIFTEAFKPFEVEILVAEVGEGELPTQLYKVDFMGIVSDYEGYVALGGQSEVLEGALSASFATGATFNEAIKLGVDALRGAGNADLAPVHIEAAVLDRNLPRRTFRRLTDAELETALNTG